MQNCCNDDVGSNEHKGEIVLKQLMVGENIAGERCWWNHRRTPLCSCLAEVGEASQHGSSPETHLFIYKRRTSQKGVTESSPVTTDAHSGTVPWEARPSRGSAELMRILNAYGGIYCINLNCSHHGACQLCRSEELIRGSSEIEGGRNCSRISDRERERERK